MDGLTGFGVLAVAAMVGFDALEPRSPAGVLAVAGARLAWSADRVLQGAGPFSLVELMWSGVALRRWWTRRAPVA